MWWIVNHGRNSTLEQGTGVKNPPYKEKGAAEAMYELTPTIIPHSVWLQKVGRETESEVNLRKKGTVGKRSFKIWFYFLITLL